MKRIRVSLHAAWVLQLLFLCIGLNAQEYPGFSAAEIESFNTAKSAKYLSPEAQKVVLVLNIIRKDGAKFWDNLAAPYIEKNEIPASRYTRSLERDLRNASELSVLSPSETLYKAANKHAVASGREGRLGHKSSAGTFEQRLKPLTREFNYLLENCDYGSSQAMDIVMNLMIDEGIPEVGHRKNILNEQINVVGISIAPHKTYGHTCVQVFGKVRD